MKELTIEEKAKHYDKSIKVAKSKIKNNKGHVLYEDDIIEIFPELKESEDERMRRWIINYLDNKALNSGIIQEKTNIKNAIAWLEKQGEKKSIDDLTQQEAMDIAVAKCFEQGEQKPAEWSEEDETGLTNTIIMLKEGASLHFNKKDITKAVDFLRTLKERYTWKPSEEQINYFSKHIEYERKWNSYHALNVLSELLEQLKKLKG